MPSTAEGEPRYQVAGLLAFHLVSQVLDEARTIVNAASESGRPWLEYLAKRRNTMPDLTYIIPSGEETYSEAPYCAGGVGDEGKEPTVNTLVTSTPQKVPDDNHKVENIIGQGDEDVELQKKISKCTSMYINQLFNMSDVENTVGDDSEENNSESIAILAKTITQMMQSCADIKSLDKNQKDDPLSDNVSRSTGHSSYTFLEIDDVGRDQMFFAEDEAPSCSCTDKVSELPQTPTTSQRALQRDAIEQSKIESSELYENSYLTMNRDYDQCSDDDGYPILQEPKGMTMQEIELLTSNTSDSEASERGAEDGDKQRGGLAATSAVSASSRKSGLVRRCRLQGARLLACLRGWWRRKTPSRRKEHRAEGPCRRCPLSSPTCRRAATLQSRLSPAPPRVAWRFNTINEAIVNSSIWKEYAFAKPNASGDV